MIRLYAGFDPRESVGFHAFAASVIANTSIPVSIAPLAQSMLQKATGGSVAEGTNAFTLTRFLVPYLEGFRGTAIFMDGADMIARDDIAKLAAMFDPWKAVQVVKHAYKTRHPRKYIGTQMEAENRDYDRKQWASVMLINCAHYAWRRSTPEFVRRADKLDMLQLRFIPDEFIGDLPVTWNWLADEHDENPHASVVHWTAGIPGFAAYKNAPMAGEWFRYNAVARYATD